MMWLTLKLSLLKARPKIKILIVRSLQTRGTKMMTEKLKNHSDTRQTTASPKAKAARAECNSGVLYRRIRHLYNTTTTGE